MPPCQPRVLVVGADSMVGSALVMRLRKTGALVLGTTRRRENVTDTCSLLDLDLSYAEAARLGAKALGANPQLVQPVQSRRSGADNEPVPAHTTLDTHGLKSALGIVPPPVQWTTEAAFANPRQLGGE